ncbi:response regulator [Vulgatibacter incomptus]|uniref:Response regulatory domain-containing protein n=1 Tax=Vulgatibacter incomptus TaxID=1391653 RepID=A0A0K1P994_9BACT|nr:response regulator [Vulgatibacter incomptus]AKU89674.1 hypothetical protein AKJ08_0061 [Vulgatibacter incomptus]
MLSVLLVDDEANFRRALAIAMRLDGHLVFETSNTADARAALERGAFDAVVINLLLQDGDALVLAGFLTGRIAERLSAAPGLPFPVLCSPHPEALRAARKQVPTALQLERPFTASALTDLVRSARHAARLALS